MSSQWRVDGYYLRIDFSPTGVKAALFDPDDSREESPISDATAPTADEAVAALVASVTFDATEDNGEIA
jgi:hypothetical protein